MKHYAGIDLSMETLHVCVVDADGRKMGALCVDSTPAAIAEALGRYGPVERAVIETGRMTPSIALGLRDLGIAIVCIDAPRKKVARLMSLDDQGHQISIAMLW